MDEKYTYRKLEEICIKGKLLGEVRYKPTYPQLIVAGFGVLICLVPGWISKLLGLFCLAIAALIQFKLEDRKVLGVYDECLVIYNEANDKAVAVDLDEIAEWNVNVTESYCVYLKLTNGLELKKQTFRVDDAHRLLTDLMEKRSTMEIRAQANRDMKFSFKAGIRRIRRFFGKRD